MLDNRKFFERLDEAHVLKTSKDYNRIVNQYISMLMSVQGRMHSRGIHDAKKYYEVQQHEWKRWVKENVDLTTTNISPIETFGQVKFGRSTEDTQQNFSTAFYKLEGMLKK